MSLLDGNKAILKFNLILESANILHAEGASPFGLMNKLNSAEWMGKEPGSCRVVDIKQKHAVPVGKTAMIDHAEFMVLVGYRPEGWISDIKNDGLQRLNGWKPEVLDRRSDGTLLDGRSQPLPPGSDPVYLAHERLQLADFNDYDFGTLLGEEVGTASRTVSDDTAPQRATMQVTETKTDCRLEHQSQKLDAMLHLIEVRYNERIVFWNGVMQLTKDQLMKFGEPGLMPVGVTLPDGRTGFLHVTHGSMTADYYELAGVGKPNR